MHTKPLQSEGPGSLLHKAFCLSIYLISVTLLKSSKNAFFGIRAEAHARCGFVATDMGLQLFHNRGAYGKTCPATRGAGGWAAARTRLSVDNSARTFGTAQRAALANGAFRASWARSAFRERSSSCVKGGALWSAQVRAEAPEATAAPSALEELEALATFPTADDSQCEMPMADASFRVRETTSRGLGLFAAVPIAANAFLFDYSGLTLPQLEYRRQHACASDYIAMIDNAAGFPFIIDAKDPATSSLGRYMNHAECKFRRTLAQIPKRLRPTSLFSTRHQRQLSPGPP
jgi:hypothetical protein